MLQYRVGSYGRVMDRHLGQANVGFLDGHVGGGPAREFYACSGWGNDNAAEWDRLKVQYYAIKK